MIGTLWDELGPQPGAPGGKGLAQAFPPCLSPALPSPKGSPISLSVKAPNVYPAVQIILVVLVCCGS